MQQLIKKSYLIVSLVVVCLLGYQTCQQTDLSKDIHFNTCVDRGIFLNECYYKALASKGKEREKWLLLLFRALPRDFETWFKIVCGHDMGFEGDTLYVKGDTEQVLNSSILYSRNPWSKFQPITKVVLSEEEIPREELSAHSKKYAEALFKRVQEKHIQKGEDVNYYTPTPYGISIKLDDGPKGAIAELKRIIPPKLYYERLIAMGIGGSWHYYLQDLQLTLCRLLQEDIRLVELILEQYTDDEIASFFYFLFDGPHPEDKKLNYKEACSYFSYYRSRNDRLLGLLKKSYAQQELDQPENFARSGYGEEYGMEE